ncbi:hypothetical protein MAR_021233 [Mya arenaria]|uniref:Uncharacterized protein n=1 Tax=Mya arenaria TaxID=6604 RepID=A0ABY7E9K2_MYAAR|nr:hypothetical protein MAR_021233 [Mya arenaria]
MYCKSNSRQETVHTIGTTALHQRYYITEHLMSEINNGIALVEYIGIFPERHDHRGVKNNERNVKYIRSKPSINCHLQQELKHKGVKQVEIEMNKHSSDDFNKQRNEKQLRNIKYNFDKSKKDVSETGNLADQIINVEEMIKTGDFVQIVKHMNGLKQPTNTLFTDQQITDIKRGAFLGMDKTYNCLQRLISCQAHHTRITDLLRPEIYLHQLNDARVKHKTSKTKSEQIYVSPLSRQTRTPTKHDAQAGEKKLLPLTLQIKPRGKIIRNWTNNNSESANHVLKTATSWKITELAVFICKLNDIVVNAHEERCRAIRDIGNYSRSSKFRHHMTDIDIWEIMSQE